MEEHQEANSQQTWKENDLETCSGRFCQTKIDDTDWDLVLTGDVNESMTNWETISLRKLWRCASQRNHFQKEEVSIDDQKFDESDQEKKWFLLACKAKWKPVSF